MLDPLENRAGQSHILRITLKLVDEYARIQRDFAMAEQEGMQRF
jgi:hypothetical protein